MSKYLHHPESGALARTDVIPEGWIQVTEKEYANLQAEQARLRDEGLAELEYARRVVREKEHDERVAAFTAAVTQPLAITKSDAEALAAAVLALIGPVRW